MRVQTGSNHNFSGKNILINAYAGIGDAILSGPVLQDLCRRFPGRIYYLENPIITMYRELQVEDLTQIMEISRELRRFMDYSPADLVAILRQHEIDLVFNLRRDFVKFEEKYLIAVRNLASNGISIADMCRFSTVAEQGEIHALDLYRRFFKSVEIHLDTYRFGWLKEDIRDYLWKPEILEGIGFFLGAGQTIKRLPLEFWENLIVRVVARNRSKPVLFAGISENEQAEGRHLSQILKTREIDHEFISGLTLSELTRKVAGLKLMVSGDTFMVHLAEALGVGLFGIYCSTSPVVYGPYHQPGNVVQSSYYPLCPLRNKIGNCEGWDLGCEDTPCKSSVDLDEAVDKIGLLHRSVKQERSFVGL